jgi:capsular exopolysaccharide synthesis family protein
MDSDKLTKTPGNGHSASQTLDFPFSGVPRSYLPPEPAEASLLDYWRVLLKRKTIVLIIWGIVVALEAFSTYRTTPIYQSVGSVAVYRDIPQVLDFKDGGGTTLDSDDFDYTVAIETQKRIMQSDALALQVARDMGWDKESLGTSAGTASASAIPIGETQLTPAQESMLIGRVRSGLQVESLPNTRMIEIRYSNPNPETAAQVLNTFMQDYVQENIKAKYESTVQASDWLTKQLGDMRLKVETSQQKLVEYQKQNDILGIDEKQNIITSKLNDLNTALTQATADRIQKEATYRLTQANSPELLTKADPTSNIEQLRFREADLQSQYARLSTQFGPNYPSVEEIGNQLKQVQASIQAEIKRIGGRLEGDYRAALQREQLLQNALDKQKVEANRLNERAIQYSLLKRDLDTNQQLYDSLLQRMKEASVAAAMKAGNIRIVDPARPPVGPISPNVPRNLFLGFFGGLAAGIVIAFLVEVLDNTVRTPEQVLSVAALPSLGIVPMSSARALHSHENGNSRVELIAHHYPKSEIAESYRALRTSILLSSLGAPPQVILITSALPEEGKTTTCLNSGIVLAQQGGKVLVVDADLRRPSLHESLGIRASGGLSTVLAGTTTADEVIVRSPQLPNLFVLPAGPTPPQPAELLGSDLMKQLIQKLRADYHHIVIDTPPALSVTDAVALSVLADSVVLVIRSGGTSKEALRRTRELLLRVNAKVTGVVVNALDLRSPELSHYYYAGANYYKKSYLRYYDDAHAEK